jgi:two-component system, OmpR family, response regulator PhoP
VRLLLIEDEQALRDQLCARLTQAGNVVESSADGQEGLYLGLEYPFDVAVIDLGLPRLPGMEIIRRLRAAGKTFPILILTVQGRWQDKVEGLRAGADDYLVKPFHVEELVARLNALQRRAAGWAQSVLRCGPVSLDTGRASAGAHGLRVPGSGVSHAARRPRHIQDRADRAPVRAGFRP